MNDEINKLIREKGHWERRIKELGGPDYSRTTSKVTDSKGMEVAEMTGATSREGAACAGAGAGAGRAFQSRAPVGRTAVGRELLLPGTTEPGQGLGPEQERLSERLARAQCI